MIYNNFKSVEQENEWAQEYIERTRKAAVEYITDIIKEVGSVGVMIDNQPALMVREKLHDEDQKIIFYFKVGQRRELAILGVEELVDISKQLHQQHLVTEWGEEKKEEAA